MADHYNNERANEIRKMSYSDINRALELARAYTSDAHKSGSFHAIIDAEVLNAYVDTVQQKYNDGILKLIKAYKLAKDHAYPPGVYRALNHLGYVYYRMGQLDRALRVLMQVEKGLSQDSPLSQKVALYNNLAEIYYKTNNLQSSMVHYHRALELSLSMPVNQTHVILNINLGNIYLKYRSFQEAEKYFTQALAYAEEVNLPSLYLMIYTDLGVYNSTIGRLDEMMKSFGMAEQVFKTMTDAYYRLYYLHKRIIHDFTLSESERLKMLDVIENDEQSAQDARYVLAIYKFFADFYEAQHSYAKALLYYKRYHTLSKQKDAEEMIQKLRIIQYEAAYDMKFDAEDVYEDAIMQQVETEKNKNSLLQRENEELSKMVEEDALTGLKNRKAIDKTLKYALNDRLSVGLLIIDVDRFKRLNDTLGHIAGDDVLKQIAKALWRFATNRGDFIGRFGGEEFIYLTTNISPNGLQLLADEVRNVVQQLGIRFDAGGKKYYVTVSVGGAWVDPSICPITKEALINLADKELYRAKHNGRNYSYVRIHQ